MLSKSSLVFCVISTVLSSTINTSSLICPIGWTTYHDSCYFFNNPPSDYEKALARCYEMGSNLFVPESLEEWEYVNEHSTVSTWSWIGLTMEDDQHNPKWLTSNAMNPLEINWLVKPFVASSNGWSTSARCAAHLNVAKAGSDYTFFLPCSLKVNSICEKNATLFPRIWDYGLIGLLHRCHRYVKMLKLIQKKKGYKSASKSSEAIEVPDSFPQRCKRKIFGDKKKTISKESASVPINLKPKEKGEAISKAYESPSATKLDSNRWSFLPPIKTQQAKIAYRRLVKDFVRQTLCKGPHGLIADFRSMKRVNDFSKMREFVAHTSTGKNRYKDVGCLDNNRVVLNVGPCSYIHANYVSTPDNPRKFICTQAPLPGTCAEFWCMVVQEEAQVILMLCNFVEQKSNKCAVYFPTQQNAPLVFNDVSVHFKSQEEYVFPFETRTKVVLTFLQVSLPGYPPHNCCHYHWMDWPDRGVPPADTAPLYLLHNVGNTKKPIIIHCSAGIGRTGSMVLLQHAMEVLKNGKPLEEMPVYLQQLRTQRSNSIQANQQYLYVHQVLLTFFRQHGLVPQCLYSLMDAFTKEYNSATTGF
ncbi:unnamed protein product [Cylicocyclus nassatus]|uniref:Uncharacterized protein n=1 Tax=Cylicocyclus nassatus TaxID=53992 RepID=A0AA36H0S8_CYLNA|nr:unnamed protein product [Cylicocyclus nassatus]